MRRATGAVPSHRSTADENTGISTDESLSVLSLRALARGKPINTSSPKALTSHPLGLGARDGFRSWWEERAGSGDTGASSPSRIHVLPFGKIISYSFRSVGDSLDEWCPQSWPSVAPVWVGIHVPLWLLPLTIRSRVLCPLGTQEDRRAAALLWLTVRTT